MVSVARYLLSLLVAAIVCSCSAEPMMLAFSNRDRTTRSWGDDTNYGSRKHYVHIVRGSRGQIKDVLLG